MTDYSRFENLRNLTPPNPRADEKLSKAAYFFLQKGDALFVSSRFEEAKGAYEKSLEAYRKEKDSQGTGLCLTRLGRTFEILGLYIEARKAYQESLSLSQASGDIQGIARGKAHLGTVSWATGDYQEALNCLKDAFAFYQTGGDPAGQALVHDLMGNLKLAMREDEEAENHYLSAYSMGKKLGDNLQLEAWNHFHLGAVALYRGQNEEAQERFSKAHQYFIDLKDDLGQVATLTHLGEIACLRKNLVEAEQHLRKSLQIVLPTHCQPLLADGLTAVAQLLKDQGEERKAVALLMVAVSHPTCRQQTKDRMVDLVLHLGTNLTRVELENGYKWAIAVSLEQMAASWLSASSPKDNPDPRKKKRNK